MPFLPPQSKSFAPGMHSPPRLKTRGSLQRELEDISGTWLQVDLDIKKRFQKFLFPEGLLYDGQKFATNRLAYCIGQNVLQTPNVSRLVSRSYQFSNQ